MTKRTVAHAAAAIANVIEIHRNRPMVSSLKLSEMFERPHFRVLKAIKGLATRGRLTTAPVVSDWIDSTGRSNELLFLDERSALVAEPFIGGAKAEEVQCRIVDAYLYYRDHYGNPPRKDLIGFKRAAMFPMTEALRERRADEGKETKERHYTNENRLCNFAVSGKFESLDESALSNDDLELLAKVRAMDGSLIAAGLDYASRKPLLAQFATRERTRRIAKTAPVAALEESA